MEQHIHPNTAQRNVKEAHIFLLKNTIALIIFARVLMATQTIEPTVPLEYDIGRKEDHAQSNQERRNASNDQAARFRHSNPRQRQHHYPEEKSQ